MSWFPRLWWSMGGVMARMVVLVAGVSVGLSGVAAPVDAASSDRIPVVLSDQCFGADPTGDLGSDWLATSSIQEVTRQVSLLVTRVDGLVGYAIDEVNREVVVVHRPGDDLAAHRAALAGRVVGLTQPDGEPPSSIVLTPLCQDVDLEARYDEVVTYLWEDERLRASGGFYELEMDMVGSQLRLVVPDRSPASQDVIDAAEARYGPDEVAIVVDPDFPKWRAELLIAGEGESLTVGEAVELMASRAEEAAGVEGSAGAAGDDALGQEGSEADEGGEPGDEADEGVAAIPASPAADEGAEVVTAVAGDGTETAGSPPTDTGIGVWGWWLAAGAVIGALAVIGIGLPRVIREPARPPVIRRRRRPD